MVGAAGITLKPFFRYHRVRKTQATAMPISLNAVRVFTAVVRHASIQRAADELCVTAGAVSRQIKALEGALGLALFVRRHRAIAPTGEGAALAARLAPAIEQIEAALADCRPRRAASPRRLSIEATPTFAMYWLIPRLPDFRRLHPDIVIDLRTAQGPVVPSPTVDLHIRRDPVHFSGLAGRPCLAERALPVAAPALCAGRRPGEGFAGLPLIRMRSRPDLWPRWFAAHPPVETPVFLDFDNTILAMQAACQGLGVALIPTLFLDALLADGALQSWPGSAALHSGDYSLLAGLGRSPAAPVFSAWLLASE
jgi:LysR family transcriptional regulator, glycine cleavage system transcriptional activator